MRKRRESEERKWLGSHSLEAREGRRAIWVARDKGHSQSVSRHQPGLPEWDQPRTDFPRRPSDQKALSYPEAQRAV